MRTNAPDAQKLAQIARKKLRELEIACELSNDGCLLNGELPDREPAIVNPLNSQILREIRFYAEGHDRIHLTHPDSVAGIPAIEFYSCSDHKSLRLAIASALKRQSEIIHEQTARLRKLGFETVPGDRLGCLQAFFDVEMVGTVLVEAGKEGVELVRCMPIGRGAPASMGRLSLDLDKFEDPCDVEIHLSRLAEKALKERRGVTSKSRVPQQQTPALRRRPRVTTQSASPDSVSLGWLVDSIGPEFFASAVLPVARNLLVDERPARLELHFEGREKIRARIFVEEVQRWQGHATPRQLGNIENFVASTLHKAAREPAQISLVAAVVETSDLLPPVAGEIWLMGVQVLEENAEEVRYVGINAQGQSRGAPRVLARHVFEKVFLPHSIGYHQMLVRVQVVTESHVTYQRLNIDRAPVAAPRQLSLGLFLANFIAEAAAQ